MKLALLSDIHGNYAALEACLDFIDANFFDGIAFLGDYVTDCPYPQRTMRLLGRARARYRTWFIRGNRDESMIRHGQRPDEWKYDSQSGGMLNAYEGLTGDDLRFLAAMPTSAIVRADGCPPFAICHGAPYDIRRQLPPGDERALSWMRDHEVNALFCGHTHRSFVWRSGGASMVNCGSVGLALGARHGAQFVQIESFGGPWRIQPYSLPYDVEGLLADFCADGAYEKYPRWARAVARSLQTGENCCLTLLQRASAIADERSEALGEDHFERAAREIGLE